MPSANLSTTSPFYKRAYGGYTVRQEQFYRDLLRDVGTATILDPMSGQAFALCELARSGARVWLGDLNPAPLMLATLRDPRAIAQREYLYGTARQFLTRFEPADRTPPQLEFVDDWFAPEVRGQLGRYGVELNAILPASPFDFSEAFWTAPIAARFLASLPILAARELACRRSSDNRTWYKKGGLARVRDIYTPLVTALDGWYEFAEDQARQFDPSHCHGTIETRRFDVSRSQLDFVPKSDYIITSPPYANRLDYSVMWAPELEMASTIWNERSNHVKQQQIGSTVIRGTVDSDVDDGILSKTMLSVLETIRNNTEAKASESYYYPFFKNYAISLSRALQNMGRYLNQDGYMIVIVRDTIRKDVLFPTRHIVDHVLCETLGMRPITAEQVIIKSHIGLMRKSSASLHGTAQSEWLLAYQNR